MLMSLDSDTQGPEGLHQAEQHPRGPLTNQQVTAGRPNAGDQAETKLGRDKDGLNTRRGWRQRDTGVNNQGGAHKGGTEDRKRQETQPKEHRERQQTRAGLLEDLSQPLQSSTLSPYFRLDVQLLHSNKSRVADRLEFT